jgi:hypothetical protein
MAAKRAASSKRATGGAKSAAKRPTARKAAAKKAAPRKAAAKKPAARTAVAKRLAAAPKKKGNPVSKATKVANRRTGGALRSQQARQQKRRDSR